MSVISVHWCTFHQADKTNNTRKAFTRNIDKEVFVFPLVASILDHLQMSGSLVVGALHKESHQQVLLAFAIQNDLRPKRRIEGKSVV